MYLLLEQLVRVFIEGFELLRVLLLVVGVDEDRLQVPLQAELLLQLPVELPRPPGLRDLWNRLVSPLSSMVAVRPKGCLKNINLNISQSLSIIIHFNK